MFTIEKLNEGRRAILSFNKDGAAFELDVIFDDNGIGVTISRDSVIITECGADYEETHENA